MSVYEERSPVFAGPVTAELVVRVKSADIDSPAVELTFGEVHFSSVNDVEIVQCYESVIDPKHNIVAARALETRLEFNGRLLSGEDGNYMTAKLMTEQS